MSRTLRCQVLRLLLGLTLALVAAEVKADAAPPPSTDVEARTLFERGSDAYSRGAYEDAMRYFQAAYNLSGRPQLLYNLAAAADHLRRDEDALDAYRKFLAGAPESDKREEVIARIAVLEKALAADQAAPVVATPAEAAKTLDDGSDSAPDRSETPRASPLYKRWWVWTTVAVVIVGAGIGIALASRDAETEGPLPGDNGLVVTALETR